MTFLSRAGLLVLALAGAVSAQEAAGPFDLVLEGGHVVDGSGNPWFAADVGVRAGEIAAVGRLRDAPRARSIDCRGRVIVPGFVDLHSHAEGGLVDRNPHRRAAPNLVTQGITTVVVNQDGRSPAPIPAQIERMTGLGIGPDVLLLIGHGSIRRRVMGRDVRRPATGEEIAAMQERLRAALRAGAWGMSAGLEYVPGRWATTGEMVALAGELVPFGGVYVLHERSSGADPMWYLPSRHPPGPPTMLDNVLELIEVGERSGAVVVATHLKARGARYWGTGAALVHHIERARARGVRIYADQYPYTTSGSDGDVVLVPAWARGGGDAAEPAAALEAVLADDGGAADVRSDIAHEIDRRGGARRLRVMEHPDEDLVGRTLAELAAAADIEPVEMALRLQLEGDRSRPGGARLRGWSMDEADVEVIAAEPWTVTATDAGIALPGDGPVHPRFYGTFPRKIRRYARERGVLSLEDAVRSGTSLPAQVLGLRDRGLVREGCRADLAVLDLDALRDRATAFEPHRYAEGVVHVFVAGVAVVADGRPTHALPGHVVLRGR